VIHLAVRIARGAVGARVGRVQSTQPNSICAIQSQTRNSTSLHP